MNWVGLQSNLKRGWPRNQRSNANELPHMYLQSRKGEVYGISVKLQLIDDAPINVVTLMTDKDQ